MQADEKELLTLWLVEQVMAVLADEKGLSNEVLEIAKNRINK
ncbi:hypothetical protein AGMMS50239_40350 [Bacteroidia bacterium]|nr:hypothetical protein AGMMS50239_40350 [Bacteroidia bacterium]